MKDTLFISDLDGTLLSNESVLTPRTIELLNDAADAGALFTPATARTPATLCEILKDVRLPLPVICMTGSAMWFPHENIYTQIRYIAPATAREIIALYRRHRFPTFVYTLRDNMIHVYHIGEMSKYEREFMEDRLSSPYKRFYIDSEGGDTLPPDMDHIILIFAMQPVEDSRRMYEHVCEEIKGCNPIFYPDLFDPAMGFMECFGAESTKGKAIERLRGMTRASKIVAFGDNVNDIPMLRQADVAVAVGNAVPELKEMADIVIGPNTEDSVARFINDRAHGRVKI